MILTLDVGNSNIVLGAYKDDVLQFTARISTDTNKTSDEYAVHLKSVLSLYQIKCTDISGTAISSVVPRITKTLSAAIFFLTGKDPFVVGPGIKTGINIRIDNPAQLGSDLLVDSVASSCLYNKPVIVIDMGTATTFSIVDENNTMIGGAILPGVQLSLEALSGRTAQLPQISIETPKKAIGTNTIDCMKSGMIYGTAGMIDGIIERFEEELGQKCFVVSTGGLAEEISKHTKRDVLYNPNLLLEGLYILYKKNLTL